MIMSSVNRPTKSWKFRSIGAAIAETKVVEE